MINQQTLKGIVIMMVIILMLSVSTVSFGQVLPEGYPPSIADQVEQTIEDNVTSPDLIGCIYENLNQHGWSLKFSHNADWTISYHNYVFPDGSKMKLTFYKSKLLLIVFK